MTPEDIKVGYYALCLSILKNYLPETAINIIEGETETDGRRRWAPEDISFLYELRDKGFTYNEIACYFGVTKGGIFKALKRAKEREGIA